jgi:hypothetical protein
VKQRRYDTGGKEPRCTVSYHLNIRNGDTIRGYATSLDPPVISGGQSGRVRIGFIWLYIETDAKFCQHGNEHSCLHNKRKIY